MDACVTDGRVLVRSVVGVDAEDDAVAGDTAEPDPADADPALATAVDA